MVGLLSEISEGQVWTSGEGYERYVGRWSRLVAPEFIAWLGVRPGARSLDVGWGTGALSQTIRATPDPDTLPGGAPSGACVAQPRAAPDDARLSSRTAGGESL